MQYIENKDLKKVKRPSRYVGGEINQVIKSRSKYNVVLTSPRLYEDGMSDYIFNKAYVNINEIPGIWCRRSFMPGEDLERILMEDKIELFSIEDNLPIKSSDYILFVIHDELEFTNIINILELANIPAFANERKGNFAQVIAICDRQINIDILSEYIDIIYSNDDIEKSLNDVINFLLKQTNNESYKIRNTFPINAIVPSIAIKDESIKIDLLKYSMDEILNIVKKCKESQGITKILFVNANYIDEYKLCDIVYKIKTEDPKYKILQNNINFCTFSNEAQNILLPCIEKGTISFDIITCSERLVEKLKIGYRKEYILNSIKNVFKNGVNSIKLGFKIGLPYETYQDVDDILFLTKQIVDIYSQNKAKNKLNIILNITNYILPKDEKLENTVNGTIHKLELKYRYIKEKDIDSSVILKIEEPQIVVLKALMKNGDNYIAKMIYDAYKRGARFDYNKNRLNYSLWEDVFAINKLDLDLYLYKGEKNK